MDKQRLEQIEKYVLGFFQADSKRAFWPRNSSTARMHFRKR